MRLGGEHYEKIKKIQADTIHGKTFRYDTVAADYAVMFIESLCHTKGTWAKKRLELIDWQEQIIRDVFGTLKPNGYRQFNTAYIEIPKKNGKSELAAAVVQGAFLHAVMVADFEQKVNRLQKFRPKIKRMRFVSPHKKRPAATDCWPEKFVFFLLS